MITHIRISRCQRTESPDVKAVNAEQYIWTLKSRLWKYFTNKKTFRYLDACQSIVWAINKTYTKTIRCRLIDVMQKNEKEIRECLYGEKSKKTTTCFEYNIGDKVRIAKEKILFKKGYLPNYTEEVFEIMKCIPRQPIPVYRIKDLHGEEIRGVYYPAELVQSVE